jgi:serine protease
MRPELSVDQLVASITATATPFADSTATAVGGAGIINAPAALAHALSLPTATPSATPSSSVTPSPSITPSASVTPTPSVSLSPNTTPTPSTIPPTTTVTPPSQAPRTSPPVPRFIESAAPKTSGKYRVGRKLKASKGKWTPTPTSYRYRWLRNGKKIKGATKATYKLTRSDRYKEISVKITVRRTGYPTTSANSSSHKIK